MIYWFWGESSIEKTTLSKKFHSFLETEKRNWRRDVFYLDDYHFARGDGNIDLGTVQALVEFFDTQSSELVVDLNLTDMSIVDDMRIINVEHFYIYNSHSLNYPEPLKGILSINTAHNSTDFLFNKLVHFLQK